MTMRTDISVSDRIGNGILSPAHNGNIKTARRRLALMLRAREKVEKVHRLLRRAPGHQPPVESAQRIVGIAFADLRVRSRKLGARCPISRRAIAYLG